MRTLVCGACALIALLLMAVSATLSYRFSYGLGGTALEAHAYAIAAGGIDILKGFMPFVIYLRLQEGRRLAAAAGLLVFVIGVLWSFTSAMGLAAQVRMDKANSTDNRQAAYREAKSQLARIEESQAKIARQRSAAEIKGEIDAKLAAAIAVTGKVTRTLAAVTDQCARPTRGTAEACGAVWRLRQELASAAEWDRLDADARTVRSRIEELRSAGAGELATSDAQADFLARGIGLLVGREVDVAWMRLAVVVLLGILLEVGSSCGLYVALGSHALPLATREMADDRPIATDAAPGTIADYAAARLRAKQGARLSMREALADYESWCAQNALTPAARQEFLSELRREGQGRRWSIAGGMMHHVELNGVRS